MGHFSYGTFYIKWAVISGRIWLAHTHTGGATADYGYGGMSIRKQIMFSFPLKDSIDSTSICCMDYQTFSIKLGNKQTVFLVMTPFPYSRAVHWLIVWNWKFKLINFTNIKYVKGFKSGFSYLSISWLFGQCVGLEPMSSGSITEHKERLLRDQSVIP